MAHYNLPKLAQPLLPKRERDSERERAGERERGGGEGGESPPKSYSSVEQERAEQESE